MAEALFESRNMGVLGVRVLGEGLPELPDVLTHAMTIPVAYWTSTTCAAVLFLGYSQDPETGDFQPEGFFPTFFLDGTTWQPHDYLYGYGWSHDFIATSESLRDLDGRAIVTAGRSVSNHPQAGKPAFVISGRVSPEVVEISLLQGGTVVRRPISNHFGAWVVCSENRGPYSIQVHDQTGAVVGSIDGQPELPRLPP